MLKSILSNVQYICEPYINGEEHDIYLNDSPIRKRFKSSCFELELNIDL